MSQSTYTEYLNQSTILKEQNKLKPILNASDYIKFKNFSLVNTIPNTKNSFSELCLNGKKDVFGMERNTANCSTFQLCRNTNIRENRTLHTEQLPQPMFRLNKNTVEKTCVCKNLCKNLGKYSKCKTRVCDC